MVSDYEMRLFREHAIALRDEGATDVAAYGMSVTFGPRPVAMPSADEIAKAIAKEPAPEGDEAYLP